MNASTTPEGQTALSKQGNPINVLNGHVNGHTTVTTRKAASHIIPKDNNTSNTTLPIPSTFNPRTYVPDMRYSTPVVRERLSRSILHEFSVEEAMRRIELAAVYRLYVVFAVFIVVF